MDEWCTCTHGTINGRHRHAKAAAVSLIRTVEARLREPRRQADTLYLSAAVGWPLLEFARGGVLRAYDGGEDESAGRFMVALASVETLTLDGLIEGYRVRQDQGELLASAARSYMAMTWPDIGRGLELPEPFTRTCRAPRQRNCRPGGVRACSLSGAQAFVGGWTC